MDKNKMLIDATHPEETRVVAVRNGRVEEFDFESAARKLLRGNIYLAKVTRVEPSLQAAFIDYGGNRHGFLAFNEIHPDYYQIPVADREMLKQEEAEAELRDEAEADERARSRGNRRRRKGRGERSAGDTRGGQSEARDEAAGEIETIEDGYSSTSGAHSPEPFESDDRGEGDRGQGPAVALGHEQSSHDVLRHDVPRADPEASGEAPSLHEPVDLPAPDATLGREDDHSAPAAAPEGSHDGYEAPLASPHGDDDTGADDDESASANGEEDQVEEVSSEEDALEEVPERPRRRARQYKIQEVIKRRQIMLVQVVKEERGNKGAALTTYISLAGRYTVLMPNTARGGGISRKITQPQDRKRLKAIAEELDVPEGMGLIIRTAGAARTKQEIKRDYEYLLRLWESVRELTLSSTAPSVVYEEGNIIKRAIRDLYSKDFEQIVVAGDAAHREAHDFMEMLMPGAGGHVAHYRAPEPLFARFGIERQLNALFSPYVTLRSGGYIVLNQTEALVSVDVNSGKSTREFSIEETALNTNLEAAEELARQLKLRDLAGLIVVDFIDMEEKRNNRAVERRLKDALRHDRARIQVGHISHFGLLEMSRQRLRAGVLEGSTSQCPHCQGTGIIRSIESVALAVLRGLEDNLLKQPSSLLAQTTAEVALYILNHKRAFITDLERHYGVLIRVEASDRMQGANFAIERFAAPVAAVKPATRAAVSMEWGFERDEDGQEDEEEAVAAPAAASDEEAEGDGGRAAAVGDDEKRGRRRRRRRGRRDGAPRDERANGEGRPFDADAAPQDGPDEVAAESGAEECDEVEASTSDTADASHADAGHSESGHGEGGEARRRGRRRGRRGGRARRREGGEGVGPEASANAGDLDAQEWSIAEVARPGAEQPALQIEGGELTRRGDLVGMVSGDYPAGSERAARSGIVETVHGQEGGSHGGRGGNGQRFSAADEAQRLATLLASDGRIDNRPPRRERSRQASAGSPDRDHTSAPAASAASSASASGLPPPQPPVPAKPRALSAPAAVLATPTPPVPSYVPHHEAPVSADSRPAAVTVSPPVPAPIQLLQPATAPAPPPVAPPVAAEAPLRPAVEPERNGHDQTETTSRPAPIAPIDEPAQEPLAASGASADSPVDEAAANRPQRRGWWQRRFGGSE